MGSKCLALDVGHVQEVILQKNMFVYPLKLILGIFGNLFVFGFKPKYSYNGLFGLFNFSLKFVSCKCYL